MKTEHTSTQGPEKQDGNFVIKTKDLIDLVKTTITTSIALFAVLGGGYSHVSNSLDQKIEEISLRTAKKTFEMFRVDDALYELDKEHGKFLTGDLNSIRQINLEFVLKYQDEILKQHPDRKQKLDWLIKYYQDKYIHKM